MDKTNEIIVVQVPFGTRRKVAQAAKKAGVSFDDYATRALVNATKQHELPYTAKEPDNGNGK